MMLRGKSVCIFMCFAPSVHGMSRKQAMTVRDSTIINANEGMQEGVDKNWE